MRKPHWVRILRRKHPAGMRKRWLLPSRKIHRIIPVKKKPSSHIIQRHRIPKRESD